MRLLIETVRLTLRPFEAADARRIAYLAGEYNVARMCSRVPSPYSLAHAQEWIASHDRLRQRGQEYPFAITLERDGLIGSCGVTRLAGQEAWEIGYWLGVPYWGQGYASEAARAVMDWAGVELDATSFSAGHFADNPASGAVLRKLGFGHAGSGELFGLARGAKAPVERYVWPAGAANDAHLAASSHHATHRRAG
jgi:RimJ/RimL family protein N-acetyltransferase